MNVRIKQSIPALLVLLAIGFSHFSQWCAQYGHACYRTILDQMIPEVTYPMYFFAIYFLPAALLLIFVPREVFKSWLRFAVWAIPVAIIYIATTPVNFTGLGMDFFPFYRDDAARLAGEVFAGASLILIIWKSIAFRRQGRIL